MEKIQLSIPEPCHESWDAMTPTEQGRFCKACAKEVIDFSNMSDTDVLNYFLQKKKADTVCGRAYPDQLERDIALLPKKKKYWQWQYILSALLFFMKPAQSKAQGLVRHIEQDSTYSKHINHPANSAVSNEKEITGVVKDEDGVPIAFATVMIDGTHTGTRTDEEGKFSLKKNERVKKIIISSLNYATKELDVNELNGQEIVLTKETKVLNEVVINGYGTIRCRRSVVSGAMSMCYVTRRSVSDTIKSWLPGFKASIKLYPNPVQRGSSFNIGMKLKQTGMYTLQVTDAAGRLITERKVAVTTKEQITQVSTGSTWAAGMYYVRLVNLEKRVTETGSFILQ